MSDEHIKDENITYTKIGKPHVVLLGAGASLATFPEGDRNGKKLPLMNNIIEVLKLEEDFKKYDVKVNSKNFEEVYSNLYNHEKYDDLLRLVERKVYNYFSDLELPDKPTIYDYLVLSLRSKDVIATFNWDPLLWQAAYRNHKVVDMPHLIFLHGNVAVGYCQKCSVKSTNGYICSKCGNILEDSKLLYPTSQKNYTDNPVTAGEWKMIENYLKYAYIFTIFGYSAPKTDVEAVKLMESAWGPKEKRAFEQTEFINRPGKSEEEIIGPWNNFIHSHHYEPPRENFFDSLIANFPRRTCEAIWAMTMEVQFIDRNPVPRDVSLSELHEWYKNLAKSEK
ncbi:MAG: hypothetical protein Q8O59_00360 [bacterium]|nr:hypothetical protein [bacterium]